MNLEDARKELENMVDDEFHCTILEYIRELEKKIGIQEAILTARNADRNNLVDRLSIEERKVERLQNELNKAKIKRLQNEEMELENMIATKRNILNAINQTCNRIEEELTIFNDQYNVIRY